MRLLLLLFATVAISFACKCKTQTSKESFCAADWVSHLKIKLRTSKSAVPNNSERRGLNNIRYIVEHKQIFKKPANVTNLPPEIFTPSEPPACGLILDVAREYLLAGRIVNGTLMTVICGQVRPDDASQTLFENVLEWDKVPQSFPPKLKQMKC